MFQDVALTQFNDNGDLVFTLQQGAGEPPGVIMEADVVPEPAAICLLCASGAMLLFRRW
jgi:hypothetical protein